MTAPPDSALLRTRTDLEPPSTWLRIWVDRRWGAVSAVALVFSLSLIVLPDPFSSADEIGDSVSPHRSAYLVIGAIAFFALSLAWVVSYLRFRSWRSRLPFLVRITWNPSMIESSSWCAATVSLEYVKPTPKADRAAIDSAIDDLCTRANARFDQVFQKDTRKLWKRVSASASGSANRHVLRAIISTLRGPLARAVRDHPCVIAVSIMVSSKSKLLYQESDFDVMSNC